MNRGALPTRPAPRPSLSDDWLEWIAENRLRQCSTESMLQTMASAGVPPEAAVEAIAAVDASPILRAAHTHQKLSHKQASVMDNLQRLWASDPDYGVIERIAEPDLETFLARHVRGCRPVVLTDVARDWPARQRWSLAALHARFADQIVEVQGGRNADSRYEENKLRHVQRLAFGDFIDRVLNEPGNDLYLTANNEALRQSAFASLLDDVGRQPRLCDPERLQGAASLWIGPAGTVTPLHHDTVMLFHTQVLGRKRWRFISPLQLGAVYNFNAVFSPVDVRAPDLDRYPDFAQAQVLETVLEPGDTLFLPLGWWHHVESLETSVSLSYTNLRVDNRFEYRNPDMAHW